MTKTINATDNQCSVCTEQYNRQSRRDVRCPGCSHRCCAVCIEKYLDISNNHPQCMQCHRPWNNQFVIEMFGNASARRIAQTKKNNMFQMQKSLFPHTQAYIRLVTRSDEMTAEIKDLKNTIKTIKDQIEELNIRQYQLHVQKHYIERDFLRYFQNRGNMEMIDDVINDSLDNLVYDDGEEEPDNSTEHTTTEASTSSNTNVVSNTQQQQLQQTYVQPCGKPDCKGFVSSKGICGLCKTTYCRKCMKEQSQDDHVCDKNDVLSVEAIKKDSKQCPNCNTMIHRISGCPDMFCTSCFTAFNWNNLRIDRNGNSNPLYYRWIREGSGVDFRRGGGDDFPNNCEALHFRHVIRSTNYVNILSKQIKTAIENALQSLHHTEQEAWRHYQSMFNNRVSSNFETATLQARAKFMMNESSEENFKTQLMRINKAKEFNDNIEQSRNLVIGYRNDMMQHIVYSNSFDPLKTLQEYYKFASYMNECHEHLRNVFYGSPSGSTYITIPATVRNLVK